MHRPIPFTFTAITVSEARRYLDLATEEATAQKEELIVQIETLRAKELELETTFRKPLAECAKRKARASAAKARAITLANNLNANAVVDIFQKVMWLVGMAIFTMMHEETFLRRQMALKEMKPFVHMNVLLMAQAVMRYDQEMQRLERRVCALGAVRRFEYWRRIDEGEEERTGADQSTDAVEDVILGAGEGEELVDLKEWPLPPKMTSWVMA